MIDHATILAGARAKLRRTPRRIDPLPVRLAHQQTIAALPAPVDPTPPARSHGLRKPLSIVERSVELRGPMLFRRKGRAA